jgi:hypothetical protein
MPTLAQIEQQILVVEGFRVRLEPLVAKTKSYPSYDFTTMAPQRWKVSDWKNIRLKAYVTLVRGISIAGGDGTPVKGDPTLGNLRDTYYKAEFGTLDPAAQRS